MILTKKEIRRRKSILVKEIKSIEERLCKDTITEYDFVSKANLPFPKRTYMSIFGSYGKFKKYAKITDKKPTSIEQFKIRQIEFKKLARSIANKNDNKLSYEILSSGLCKSPRTVAVLTSQFGGGIVRLCNDIKCEYITNRKQRYHTNPEMPSDVAKQKVTNYFSRLARENNGAVSRELAIRNSYMAGLSPSTLSGYVTIYFGGFERLCKHLNITWVPSTKGIDYKELDILKDIRRVYLDNDRTMTRNLYAKSGNYSLELIDEYFGSFNKACQEINVHTNTEIKELLCKPHT